MNDLQQDDQLAYQREILHECEDFQTEHDNPKIRVFTRSYLDRSYSCDRKARIKKLPSGSENYSRFRDPVF